MSISEPPPATPSGASSADAAIELSSSVASLELSVVGSDFTPVAAGAGRLSVVVPAGIYQIVARAGPVVDRRLITLAPGQTFRDDRITVRFPSPAPVSDTTTSHEYHQAAAEQASGMIGQMAGPPSGLAVIVRDVRGTDGPPLDANDVACFSLLDGTLTPVGGFDQGWQMRTGEAVAFWSGRLPPGGWALRTNPSLVTSGDRTAPGRASFDQSLWLSEHWQTIVFLTTGPGGPQTSAASIHMAQLGIGWSPYDTAVGLALELANWGLREGRSVLPADLLNLLLNTKFVNPMLGIVGAHSLLLRADVDWDVFQTVLHNLELMVPGHPDVRALRWTATRRHGADGGPQASPASAAATVAAGAAWPPMLLASYRTLLEMDATESSAIADGSPAELVAASLLVQGIWTSWAPIEFKPPPPPPPPPPPGAVAAPSLPTAEAVLSGIARDPSLLERVPVDDPAAARVAGYLTALGTLEGSRRSERISTLTPQEIALATTLPVATVERSLTKIGVALGPPSTPPPPHRPIPADGGGGISRTLLATLAAGALLLVGAVGATAWCAGNESCPIQIGPDQPTRQPTEPPITAPPVTAQPPTPEPPTPEPATAPPTSEPATPQPTPFQLEYSSPLTFEPVIAGFGPTRRQLTVRGQEMVPLSFEIGDNPDQAFATDPACAWLESSSGGFECTVVVTFEPIRVALYEGTLHIRVGDEIEPRRVQLLGEGSPVILEVQSEMVLPSMYLSDSPSEGDLPISASAPVDLKLAIDLLPESFEIWSGCDWTSTEPGAHLCNVRIGFAPETSGWHYGELSILTPELNAQRRTVFLSGYAYSAVDLLKTRVGGRREPAT